MAFDGTERKSCIKCEILTFDNYLFTFRPLCQNLLTTASSTRSASSNSYAAHCLFASTIPTVRAGDTNGGHMIRFVQVNDRIPRSDLIELALLRRVFPLRD